VKKFFVLRGSRKTQRVFWFAALIITLIGVKAFANTQNPVAILSIQDTTVDTRPGTPYNIKLEWKRPLVSDAPEPNLAHDERFVRHDLQGYSAYMKNATRGDRYVWLDDLTASDVTYIPDSSFMLPGSIYMFKITPYHYHHRISNGDPVLATISGEEAEVLYLTDITVDAEGGSDFLTVTWDDPTFNGLDVFDEYKITYSPYPGQANIVNFTKDVYVKKTDPNVTILRDGRLNYVITDRVLELGKRYVVKVAPMIIGRFFRSEIFEITIGTKKYKIAYPKPEREYKNDAAYSQPMLNIRDRGSLEIELFWNSLLTSTYIINKVTVLKSYDADFINSEQVNILIGDSATEKNLFITEKPNQITYYQLEIAYQLWPGGENFLMYSNVAPYDPGYLEFAPYAPEITDTSDNAKFPLTLDITWKAFLRAPFGANEAGDSKYGGLFLDRKIAYDVYITDDLLNYDNYNFDRYPVARLLAEELELTDVAVPLYKATFSEFYKRTPEGFIRSEFEENKTYYIKIVAVRLETDQISAPAHASHYINPIGALNNRPVVMSRPPLEVTEETSNSIKIKWSRIWQEVYDETTGKWFAKVGVAGSSLVFGFDADVLEQTAPERVFNLTEPRPTLDAELAALGYAGPALASRVQILEPGVKYELRVLPYEDMIANGGYQNYVDIISLPESEALWSAIEVSGTEYEIKNLAPNAPYAIFLRPYGIDAAGKKSAYLPAFTAGATLPATPPAEPAPTVPSLELIDVTDTTATVRWLYKEFFNYELSITGEKGETVIPLEDFRTEGDYGYYVFENLFPKSEYLARIRAISKSAPRARGDKIYSAWSNPAIIKTMDLIAPKPPQGFSARQISGKISGKIEAEWLKEPELSETMRVTFDNVVPNSEYFARAKTRLTAAYGSSSAVEKLYSYVIQLSRDESFNDYIEIIEPPHPVLEGALYKESDWTEIYWVYSGKTDGEYGGNPGLYPLPDEDFDITYEISDEGDYIKYRFRSNKRYDYHTDQRLITDLIRSKRFYYAADLSSYDKKRYEIETPPAVLRAFDVMKKTLIVKFRGFSLVIPPGALKEKIRIKVDTSDAPKLKHVRGTYAESYAGGPVYADAEGARIVFNLRRRRFDASLNAFFSDGNSGGWVFIPSEYDNAKATQTVFIERPGNYAVISRGAPREWGVSRDWTNIFSKINIMDMEYYRISDFVGANQINNIAAALLKDVYAFNFNSALSEEDANALKNAGIYVEGGAAQKIEAYKTLERVVEIKTGEKISALHLDEFSTQNELMTFADLFFALDIILQVI
jgi:hypothetical protein